MTILIDADGCPGVSDVMKNKTSSRTLPLIRLNLRPLTEMVGILPRAKQQPAGLIACGLRAAALFSSAPSLPQKRHQPEPVPFIGGDGGIRTHFPKRRKICLLERIGRDFTPFGENGRERFREPESIHTICCF